MKTINYIEDILILIKKVKAQNKFFKTNFFLDKKKIELWIALELLNYEEIGDTIFLIRENKGFNNLYFISPDQTLLANDINLFLIKNQDKLFVADVLSDKSNNENIKDIFLNQGFSIYTRLKRMFRIVDPIQSEMDASLTISYANKHHARNIYDQLQKYFDIFAEQLPLIEEIYSWIESNSILIYSDGSNVIQGFLIFELIGQTSYLRYWFVRPDYREMKIGSSLLRRYFFESKNTTRQLFWVIESNENAIKRYMHYGFNPEDLFDYVLINKNIKYEGKNN